MVARNMLRALEQQRDQLEANYGLTGAPQHKLDLLWLHCWSEGERHGLSAAGTRLITEELYAKLARLVI
jgi:hypothetical protein